MFVFAKTAFQQQQMKINLPNYMLSGVKNLVPIGGNGKRIYFNAGIFLVSKPNINVYKKFKDIPNLPSIMEFGDQTFLNYLTHKNEVPFESFDHTFNRMHLGKKDESGERFKANFIHYAGPDVYGNGNKFETMMNDYKKIYNKL
jgi:hypothetical protein